MDKLIRWIGNKKSVLAIERLPVASGSTLANFMVDTRDLRLKIGAPTTVKQVRDVPMEASRVSSSLKPECAVVLSLLKLITWIVPQAVRMTKSRLSW
jgi:hypothetical protein